MASLKEKIIQEILIREGGYVDNPKDKGGVTNHGITEAVARKYGWRGSMKQLPLPLAKQILEDLYWNALSLGLIEQLSPSIAEELADTAVNMGVGRAAEFLQCSLNALNKEQTLYGDLALDYSIGPTTIAALKAYLKARKAQGELVLLRMLNCLQGAKYVALCQRREANEEFVFGWFLNRVEINGK